MGLEGCKLAIPTRTRKSHAVDLEDQGTPEALVAPIIKICPSSSIMDRLHLEMDNEFKD